MAESAPDGLASLSAQRDRARRSMPPTRHPVSVEAPLRAPEPSTSAPPPPAAEPTAAVSRPRPRRAAAPAATPAPLDTGAPVKVTLYVDGPADEFMEAARVAGLLSRPKVDISRSAVVRLALRRLMDEMSPAQVKAVLEQQDVGSGPGRKRR